MIEILPPKHTSTSEPSVRPRAWKLPYNYTLQLAVFHTLFNLLGILVMLPLIKRLVALLRKLIPSESIEVERPIYLGSASRGLRDVAVEAVRKESIRLYDFAADIIIDGLSIRRDVLESEEKIKRIVKKSTDVVDEDIDDLYERKLKALYGAIVEYVIDSRGGYSDGTLKEEMNSVRQAGQHVIEAVKGVKHLRKNLTRALQSDNDFVKKEYNRLRRLIIKVLRDVETTRVAERGSASILPLDKIKLEIEEKTGEFSHGLDTLIRDDHIDVQIATSLMNDISYCRDICWDLVEAGAVLFSTSDRKDKDALKSVALDEHEIIEMLETPDGKAAP